MHKHDRIRMQHMAEAAHEALRLARGRQRSDLDTDHGLVLALVKSIEIIGEAANNVSAETRRVVPDIPWPAIIAMRHRLVHGYFDVNLDIVWTTLAQDLPGLLETIENVLLTEDTP